MTTHVIVRDVSPNVSDCQIVCNERVPINLERLREQHKGYVDNIRQAATLHGGGLNLIELPALEAYPDSMFVEDVALMFDSFALITRPGAETRQGETEHIAPTVANLMESLGRPVYRIEEPGTVDGGDVLIIGKHAFVGRSTRTNDEGFAQVKAFAAKHGYTTHQVGVRGGMHLKCAASMITPKTVLINPKWIERTTFTTIGFGVLDVEPGEPDSANVLSFLLKKDSSEPGLRIIVVPERFPALAAKLEKYASRSANRSATAGEDSAEILRVVVTAVDEVAKAEGALTCCSLIAYS